MHQKNNKDHTPVLLIEVLEVLDPQPGQTYLDLTAGYGGHAEAILAKTNFAPAILVDRDQLATDYLKQHFSETSTKILNQDFLSASQVLDKTGQKFDLILADLGLSSPHLNKASRGFSFQTEGPLDMRMDTSQELTADSIVNNYSLSKLTAILRDFGQEPKATRIAQQIVKHRPIHTTVVLANIIANTARFTSHKIHPATRSFQALRIAVNDELGQLEAALPIWTKLLNPDGHLAVISFQSLEDRMVKQALAEVSGNSYDAKLKLLTKHPIKPSRHEIVSNPRSRSAKLRAAAKIKTYSS